MLLMEKFRLNSEAAYINCLDFLKDCLRREQFGLSITIKKHIKPRTPSQNRYYFLIIAFLYREGSGYHKDEWHEMFKKKFGYKKEMFGEMIPRSTTTYTTKEFTDYIDRIKLFALESLGLVVPEATNEEFINHYSKYL